MNTLWLNVPVVLVLAALLTVVYNLGDAYIMRHKVKDEDPLIAMMTYLVMGGVIGLLINLFLVQTPAGQLIDSSFTTIGEISSEAMLLAVVTGVFSAIATGVYLWAYQKDIDPSLVVPLKALVVAYVAVADIFVGNVTLGGVFFPLLLVIVGVFIALGPKNGSWKATVGAIVLILVVHNGLSAAAELWSKTGVDGSDAVSFGFYRFLWLTVSAVIMTAIVAVSTGKMSNFVESIKRNFAAVPFIAAQMTVVFFALGWANKGLGESNATVKNLVMSLPIVLVVLASALVNKFRPGTFETIPATKWQWVLRLVGAAFMMLGIVLLQ